MSQSNILAKGGCREKLGNYFIPFSVLLHESISNAESSPIGFRPHHPEPPAQHETAVATKPAQRVRSKTLVARTAAHRRRRSGL